MHVYRSLGRKRTKEARVSSSLLRNWAGFLTRPRAKLFIFHRIVVTFLRIFFFSLLLQEYDDRSDDDEDQERSLIGDTAGCGATRFQNERVVASFGADQLSRAKRRLASRSCSQAARQTP